MITVKDDAKEILTATKAKDQTVTIKAEIVDKGGNIVSKQAETYTLVFVSPFKNSKFESKAKEYTLYNEDEKDEQRSIDLSKEISLSTTIGKEYVILDNTGKINDENADLFGVKTPEYKLTTPNTNLTINGGTITWNPNQEIGAQFQEFDAQVKITIKSKYHDLTKTITIHVKPGKSPAVEEE